MTRSTMINRKSYTVYVNCLIGFFTDFFFHLHQKIRIDKFERKYDVNRSTTHVSHSQSYDMQWFESQELPIMVEVRLIVCRSRTDLGELILTLQKIEEKATCGSDSAYKRKQILVVPISQYYANVYWATGSAKIASFKMVNRIHTRLSFIVYKIKTYPP